MANNKPVKVKRLPLSDRKLAQKVLAVADLDDIRLLGCDVKNGLKGSKPERHIQITIAAHNKVVKDDKTMVIDLAFDLAVSSSENEKQQLRIQFSYQLLYSLSTVAGLNEDNFNSFTRWIGMNIGWPYAREFVHDMTSRLGLPSLKLPLYKPSEMVLETISQSTNPKLT